jgi:hypothetical protein
MDLLLRSKRRVRKKWAGVFVINRARIASVDRGELYEIMRRVHGAGVEFSSKGLRRLTNALRKCGHRVVVRRAVP